TIIANALSFGAKPDFIIDLLLDLEFKDDDVNESSHHCGALYLRDLLEGYGDWNYGLYVGGHNPCLMRKGHLLAYSQTLHLKVSGNLVNPPPSTRLKFTPASSFPLPADGPGAKRPISPPARLRGHPVSLPSPAADQRLTASPQVRRLQSVSSFAAIST